jgi:hypothetical protein
LTDFLLYTAPGGQVKVECILHDETIWLPQKRHGSADRGNRKQACLVLFSGKSRHSSFAIIIPQKQETCTHPSLH